jgi:hypothetical protein
MRANIIACLLAVAFFACLIVLDSRARLPTQVNLVDENEPVTKDDNQPEGRDAYKMAVLFSVGAAILSLFA